LDLADMLTNVLRTIYPVSPFHTAILDNEDFLIWEQASVILKACVKST